MKKYLVSAILLVVATSAVAQVNNGRQKPFKLNCDGFVSHVDESKRHIEMDFAHLNIESKQLKERTLNFIEKTHSQVKSIEHKDNSIVVEGVFKNKVKMPHGFNQHAQDVHYKAVYEIKDNKVLFSIQSAHTELYLPKTYGRYTSIVNESNTHIKAKESFWSNIKGIYTPQCDLKRPTEKSIFENWAHNHVSDYYSFVSNANPYDHNLVYSN